MKIGVKLALVLACCCAGAAHASRAHNGDVEAPYKGSGAFPLPQDPGDKERVETVHLSNGQTITIRSNSRGVFGSNGLALWFDAQGAHIRTPDGRIGTYRGTPEERRWLAQKGPRY